MDVGCSEGRRRGRSSWGAVWSRTPGSLQAPPIFSLLSRGLSPLGVDGRGHPDLLLLRHLPGVPDGPGQLQQVPQQLLQVSGGGAWGWRGASLRCDWRQRGGCGGPSCTNPTLWSAFQTGLFSRYLASVSVPHLLFSLPFTAHWLWISSHAGLLSPSSFPFPAGTASRSASSTVAPASWPGLWSSPSWASCPGSRGCPYLKWPSQVGTAWLSGSWREGWAGDRGWGGGGSPRSQILGNFQHWGAVIGTEQDPKTRGGRRERRADGWKVCSPE